MSTSSSSTSFAANARSLIKRIRATACIQCAVTGDLVASRVDTYPTTGGLKTDVMYWYVPANASEVSELVKLDIAELAGGFFKKPINPFTWEPIIPVSRSK